MAAHITGLSKVVRDADGNLRLVEPTKPTVLDLIVDALDEEDRIRRRERNFMLLLSSPAVISFVIALAGACVLV